MIRVLAVLVAGLLGLTAPALPDDDLPFVIHASEDVSSQFPGSPRLQSFAFGQWQGRWLFIGGRISGYHGVGGGSADFLRRDANRDVWVIDTTVAPARTYHLPVEQLGDSLEPVKEQWSSAAPIHAQDGDQLYIAGGYGQDRDGRWTTFDILSRINLPMLIDGVMRGSLPERAVAFTRTPVVQSTGGGLIKLDDGSFYLVMGHVFEGSYTAFAGHGERNSAEASQRYLNEIRRFRIDSDDGGELKVIPVATYSDDNEFHRRDLNVAHVMSHGGLGFAAYGGVFTPGSQLNYTKPVYVFNGMKPAIDHGFEQKMNAYTCAQLLMYSRATNTMFTTFFGGISRYMWDPAGAAFVAHPKVGDKSDAVYLDGLQWSDQISTIRRVATDDDSRTGEEVNPSPLPAFIGSGTVFIPSPGLSRAHPDTDILAFEPLQDRTTFVGYLYGGIRAYPYRFPYLRTSTPHNSGAVSSQPNDLVIKVYVAPKHQR